MGTVFWCTYYPKVFPAWVLLILEYRGVRLGYTHTGGNSEVYPSTLDLLQIILNFDTFHKCFSIHSPFIRKISIQNLKLEIGDTHFLDYCLRVPNFLSELLLNHLLNHLLWYYRTTINTNASSSAGHGGFPPPSWSPPKSAVAFSPSPVRLLDVRVRAVATPSPQRQERWRARRLRPTEESCELARSVRAHSPHSEWTLPRASSVRDSLSRSAREDGERSAATSNSNRKQHKNTR